MSRVAVGIELERIYREHGERLWRAVLAYSADAHVAEDAVAEAFAQALRRGSDLRDPLAWIWRVAFRVAAGELKRARTIASTPREGSYEMTGEATEILEALGRLSPMQRGSIVLHHYVGHPVREVAEILGSTPQAVRVHLWRGRRRLRELLGGRDA